MAAHSLKGHDGGSHIHRLPEQLHLLRALQDLASERAHRLIAHKQHGTFRAPEIVLQVMADPACLTHAGRGYDHLRRLVKIDGLRLVAGDGKPQPREGKGVDPLIYQSQRFFIKTFVNVSFKDFRSLHSQRAVHIHREDPVPGHQAIFLNLSQDVQDLLRSSHGKGGDHHISAPVKRLLDQPGKILHIIRTLRLMQPVPVGGLHDHIIRPRRFLRIADQRLAPVSHVSGKAQLSFDAVLLQPYLDAGGTEQMPDIRKPDLHPFADPDLLPIIAGDQQGNGSFRVLHRIGRLIFLRSCVPLRFPALPLRLLLLDMRTVTEHDIAQLRRRPRRKDLPPEPPRVQLRQHARMIHMGMRQKNIVDLRLRHRKRSALKGIHPLLHALIHQHMHSCRFQIMAASRHLMVRSDKNKLHFPSFRRRRRRSIPEQRSAAFVRPFRKKYRCPHPV